MRADCVSELAQPDECSHDICSIYAPLDFPFAPLSNPCGTVLMEANVKSFTSLLVGLLLFASGVSAQTQTTDIKGQFVGDWVGTICPEMQTACLSNPTPGYPQGAATFVHWSITSTKAYPFFRITTLQFAEGDGKIRNDSSSLDALFQVVDGRPALLAGDTFEAYNLRLESNGVLSGRTMANSHSGMLIYEVILVRGTDLSQYILTVKNKQ